MQHHDHSRTLLEVVRSSFPLLLFLLLVIYSEGENNKEGELFSQGKHLYRGLPVLKQLLCYIGPLMVPGSGVA